MVPERSEYKKLLNEEYFYKAKLCCGGCGIEWDEFVDMHADGMITVGEKME